MAAPRQSAFGELCVMYRERLDLTQPELRKRVIDLPKNLPDGFPDEDIGSTYISVNTISNWEKARPPGARFPKPFKSNVKAVALAFGLLPGTQDYQQFLAAARLPGPFETDPGAAIGLPVIDSRPPRDGFVAAGRDPQIRQVRTMIGRMLSGDPGIAFVSGVAGTGKTRLIEEICAEAVNNHSGLMIAWGECTSDDATIAALHPFRQIVGMLTGGLQDASSRQLVSTPNLTRLSDRAPDMIRTLLHTSPDLVETLVTAQALAERATVFDLDQQVTDAIANLGERTPPRISGRVTGNSLFDFLAACSTIAPLILVIDDLHWVDTTTANMLFHLLRRLHGSQARLAIIGSFRVAELESLPGYDRHPMRRILNESARMFGQTVADLSLAVGGSAGRQYIDGALARQVNNLGESFRRKLFAHTAGFPLVVKGVLDLFEHDGVIAPDASGTMILTREPDWHQVPAEIDGIYRERFERMPAPLQTMLLYAAVQGDTFNAEIVMAAMKLDPAEGLLLMESQLLRVHRLIRAEGTITVNRKRANQYRLEHALLREFLIQLPSPFEMSRMHEETAHAIGTLYGNEPHECSALAARHFEQAGNWLAAAQASLAAGDFAMQKLDTDTALTHFRKIETLHIAHDSPDLLIRSLARAADCQRSRGDLDKGISLANRAIALAKRHHTPHEQARSLASLAMIEYDLGHIEPAVKRLREALAIRQQLEQPREISHLHVLLSHVLYARGEYEEAIADADAAQHLGMELHDLRLQVEALIARTNCFVDLGDFTSALNSYAEAREFAGASGNAGGLALCMLNSALCHLELGDLDAAERAIEEIAVHLRGVNMPQLRSCVEYYGGLIAEARGHTELANRQFQASRVSRSRRGQFRSALDPLGGMLRIAIRQDDRNEAIRLLHDTTSELQRLGFEGIEHKARLYLTLIDAHQFLGDRDQAMYWQRAGLAFLQHQAARIADPALRASYLERVPAHHQLYRTGPLV